METRLTLLAKLKDQHDQAAWLDFSNYYKPYLFAVLKRMNIDHHDSEDIIQTVLFLVWKNYLTLSTIQGKDSSVHGFVQ